MDLDDQASYKVTNEYSKEVKKSNFRQYGQMEKQREEQKREDQRRERVRRKKMQGARKGRKVMIHYVFPMMCGSGGSKSRLANAGGVRSQLAR